MKVLDPQAALLTTSEVHRFLAEKPPRPSTKNIGSYPSVNLKNYERVREDFQHYVASTVPYIENFPPPETFVKAVVPKLRNFGLTKAEVFTLINLGVGLPRNQPASKPEGADDAMEVDEEQPAEDVEEPDDRQLLSLIVEELEERFSGEEGEAKIEKILNTMRTEYDRAHVTAAANGANGTKRK
ncbi:hypothetical protein LTR67_007465 [Exophiala xenobiotica]